MNLAALEHELRQGAKLRVMPVDGNYEAILMDADRPFSQVHRYLQAAISNLSEQVASVRLNVPALLMGSNFHPARPYRRGSFSYLDSPKRPVSLEATWDGSEFCLQLDTQVPVIVPPVTQRNVRQHLDVRPFRFRGRMYQAHGVEMGPSFTVVLMSIEHGRPVEQLYIWQRQAGRGPILTEALSRAWEDQPEDLGHAA